jgi:hypothetical protein
VKVCVCRWSYSVRFWICQFPGLGLYSVSNEDGVLMRLGSLMMNRFPEVEEHDAILENLWWE